MFSLFAAIFALALGSFAPVSGKLVNITIDDINPQIIFQPSNHWSQQPCPGCGVVNAVNATLALGGTWHDATSTSPDDVRNVTVPFSGTAIYLFGIEPNFIPNGITTFSNLTIQLDGDVVGYHVHIPNNTSDVAYNVPIYANSSMQNGQHSVVVSMAAGSTDDKDHSLLLFDYAIYTADDDPISTTTLDVPSTTPSPPISTSSTPSFTPSPPQRSKVPIGAIVGAVVGSQVIIVGALLLYWQHRRRRSNSRRKFDNSPSVPQDYPSNFYRPAPAPPSLVDAVSRFGGHGVQSTIQPQMAPPAYDSIQGPSGLPAPVAATEAELDRHSAKQAYGVAPYTGT